MKKYFKPVYVAVCFVISVLVVFPHVAVAVDASPSVGCNPEMAAYDTSSANFSLDIQRTLQNTLNASVVSLFTTTNGASPNKVIMCQKYVKDEMMKASGGGNWWVPPGGENPPETSYCAPSGDQDAYEEYIENMCKPLVSYIGTEGSGEESGGGTGSASSPLSVYKRSIEGSLIGMGTKLEGFSRKEPLPVNLAYYWDQSVGKIPVVGHALAQSRGGEAYKNLPVVAAMYSIWRLSLRVALGLISVVLLYAGLMIVMRKKVNSQLVVSVQYALPKIVIAIVLIIFSYPIGATITSIGFGLYRGAFPLVFKLMTGMPNADAFASGTLSIALIADTLNTSTGGLSYMIVALIMSLLLGLAKIILYFKVLIVYIKMSFSIVTAPLEFALGAVPGNDTAIGNWFTRMAKYALTLFGMGVVIPLTLVVGIQISTAYSMGTGETGGWGVVISVIAPLLVVIFGFGMGMGMEGKVDELFGGGKKRK
jgi:hypothetical protein